MITVISGTNRVGSETIKIADYIVHQLRRHTNQEIGLIDLMSWQGDLIRETMYQETGQSPFIVNIQDKWILPAEKLWFVFPEYNGGVPGILKLFIDAVSVRDLRESFHGKKACLTGISSGRAGNLRGMDHFTNILNYLQVVVFPNRLPISSIRALNDENGSLADALTLKVISEQVKEFISF